MRTVSWIVRAVACALCCVVGSAEAEATAGPDLTANWTYWNVGEYTMLNDTTAHWTLGGSTQPIEVIFEPTAGPILKTFTVPQDADADHGLVIEEYWHNNGNNSIYDWHEVLMVPDDMGGWRPSTAADGLSWYGSVTVTPAGGIYADGTTIEITWSDGLPYCTEFSIQKTVEIWMYGNYFEPGDQFAILEYPTPEPATMALMGLGLGSLWMRKRRKA